MDVLQLNRLISKGMSSIYFKVTIKKILKTSIF